MSHLAKFRESAQEVSGLIDELEALSPGDQDIMRLITWIKQNYNVYVKLAEQITQIRQASDWNKALFLMSTETVLVAEDIKLSLIELQNTHIKELESHSIWLENATLVAFISTLILLFF